MQHKTLKLSTLAILIAGATHANAAVYQVVEVASQGDVESLEYFNKDTSQTLEFYGQAIKASADGENCFNATCNNGNDYTVVGESRFGTDGINYRDEAPFIYDNEQSINDLWSFERYCNDNLGPNTCDVWAESQYFGKDYNRDDRYDASGFGGLLREQQAWVAKDYFANAFPLVDGKKIATFAVAETGYEADNLAVLGSLVGKDSSTHITSNAVVNGIVTDSNYAFGVTSSGYFDNGARYARQFAKRGFINTASKNLELGPIKGNAFVEQMGQSLAWDAVEYPAGSGNLLVVGSASYDQSDLDDSDKLPDDVEVNGQAIGYSTSTLVNCGTNPTAANLFSTPECQYSVFANNAAFWVVDTANNTAEETKPIASMAVAARETDSDRSAQASGRAVALVNDKPVIVGFTTEDVDGDYYASRAAVFTPKTSFDVSDTSTYEWDITLIPGTDIEDSSSDRQYRYSIATDINENNKVVGVSKNYRSESRSYAENIFIYDGTNTKYIDSSINADIFFNGYNGFPSAINNNDQIVGWVDSESANQVDGKFRRQRGFTYNAGAAIANSPLTANGAWMLDDLINDNGAVSAAANQFRIAQATDINDAGVISATALKCAGGYQDLSNESQCSGDEKLVAVKLVPIPDGTIEARPEISSSIERSGASLGMFALTMLGWIGFRRRK
ncbi:DUF3466 family protein [Pseudomonadota bacterium]